MSNSFHDAHYKIATQTRSLRRLAESFLRTGNEFVFDQLSMFADEIDSENECMREKYEQHQKSSLDFSKQMVGGLLSATLHGCIKNKEHD